MSKNIFEGADIIHTYTRAQGIADGVLVDARQGELDEVAKNAGIKFPVAVTSAVWAECFELTPAAKRACNDLKGRAWDVFYMMADAIRRGARGQVITFQVYVVRKRVRPTLTTLKAVCGPGDNAEPVITIMFPEED